MPNVKIQLMMKMSFTNHKPFYYFITHTFFFIYFDASLWNQTRDYKSLYHNPSLITVSLKRLKYHLSYRYKTYRKFKLWFSFTIMLRSLESMWLRIILYLVYITYWELTNYSVPNRCINPKSVRHIVISLFNLKLKKNREISIIKENSSIEVGIHRRQNYFLTKFSWDTSSIKYSVLKSKILICKNCESKLKNFFSTKFGQNPMLNPL